MESRLVDSVTVQQVFRHDILLNHWISQKQTHTGFQWLSSQILKGYNSYSMFSASISSLCQPEKTLLFGWRQMREFSKMPKWAGGLRGCTQKWHTSHRHRREPLPQFFFPLIFLPLQGHPLLTPRIQFLWSQGYEGASISPEGTGRIKAGIEAGFEQNQVAKH